MSAPYTIIKHILQQQYPLAISVTHDIHQAGGISYLVGGSVRDMLLNMPIKDLDIEVHKVSQNLLEKILNKYGAIITVGKSFGVLRITGQNIDWSLPRIDSAGRKPKVTLDPALTIEKAFERRDVTINALGINLMTYELVDPFNGLHDLKAKILRTPNPARFIEDPLRFYRIFQFIGRFGMQPDITLSKICSTMFIANVAQERIELELKKWLLLSPIPSQSLRWLLQIERLQEIFPELQEARFTLQEPKWHPEGALFEHLLQTVDAAAYLSYASDQEKLICMYAALCHDLGKLVATRFQDGRIRSLGHAQQGVPLAKRFLKRITRDKHLIKAVEKLVNAHMLPPQLVESNASLAAYKRLAFSLAPDATMEMLAKVSLADRQGRNGNSTIPLKEDNDLIKQFLQNARSAGVLHHTESPILTGKDLLPEITAGPHMGFLLKKAYTWQLEKGIKDKAILKQMILQKYLKPRSQ